MERNFELALNAWLTTLSPREKRELDEHHCGMLTALRYVQLDTNLLYAALNYWDPATHCFCFREKEISPLPEELGAIVSWPADWLPCLPNISDYFCNDYERYLGLDSRALRKIVHGREIDLIALVEHFKTVDARRKVYHRRALVLCLFARFLFAHNDLSIGHASLITIVEQCESGRTPMPLCTGELFMTLDRLKRDPYAPWTSCPYLLQVWLMERMSLVEPPRNLEKYSAKGFFSRKRVHTQKTSYEWFLILGDQGTLVRWTIPWWGIKSMVHAQRASYVRIASLTTLTFYFPVRVMRQYGKMQYIPDMDTLRPNDKPMLSGNAKSWEEYWQARPKLEVTPLVYEDGKVSKHYLAWMAATETMHRAEARAAEKRDIGARRFGNHAEVSDCPVPKSRAVSVKDRLGPRKVPVWDRLERLLPLTIDTEAAERRARHKGDAEETAKGKGKAMAKTGRSKKKWIDKTHGEVGEGSGMKKAKEPTEKDSREE